MLIAGIFGTQGIERTASLVSSILSSNGQKVSVVDSKHLIELESRKIKSYINELDKNNVNVLILKVDIMDVMKDFFNNIKFSIMLYTDKSDEIEGISSDDYSRLMHKSFSLLEEKGIVIVNVDDSELIKFLHGIRHHIITYGFNSKASMTTSSIGDTLTKADFMCCLQRTISDRNGTLVEPQEYRIKIKANEFDTYNILAAATFAVMNGIDLNNVKDFGL
jgi:UDP-N-acetylmuramyl tripeptide synthase